MSARTADALEAGASRALGLSPFHGDPSDLGVRNGHHVWAAYSLDPSFAASVAEGEAPLESGWYSASVVLDCRSGEILEPQIYLPDAHGGYSEERSVKLRRKGQSFSAEFQLGLATRIIRFDPSRAPCEFTCDVLQLTPIAEPIPERAPLMQRLRDSLARPKKAARQIAHQFSVAGRKQRVLASIDRNGQGIEIGPSHDPIAPKRDGFKVHIIDHASREELLAKYQSHAGLVLDKVEEVDFVWHGQSYVELTGKPNHYDWIIASHVIEHTPDLIAFLADCDSILNDRGVLSLVVPDKRYCFDRFRPITGLARVLDSQGAKVHSPGAVAEYLLNAVGKSRQLSWDAGAQGEYTFFHSAEQAAQAMQSARDTGAYHDIHNWCFVPHSFRLLLNDLYVLCYTRMREVSFHPTEGFEFYVTLGRHGAGPQMSRFELLKEVERELAVQDL